MSRSHEIDPIHFPNTRFWPYWIQNDIAFTLNGLDIDLHLCISHVGYSITNQISAPESPFTSWSEH